LGLQYLFSVRLKALQKSAVAEIAICGSLCQCLERPARLSFAADIFNLLSSLYFVKRKIEKKFEAGRDYG
jgi:hypothetical protein